MKRHDFQVQLEQHGLKMSEYGAACYFAENELCSLVLGPFPAEEIRRAKLAIRGSGKPRRTVVDNFLRAAGVESDSALAEALEGSEYRGERGSKHVTVAVIESEIVITVTDECVNCG